MSDHPHGDQANRDEELNVSGAGGENIEAPGIVPDDADAAPRNGVHQTAGKLTIITSAQSDQNAGAKGPAGEQSRHWDDIRVDPVAASVMHGRRDAGRKTSAIIAVAVVAGIAGAFGTAMATAGFAYFASKPDPAVAANNARALDESMTRIESDLAALRSNVDRAAKANASQAGKTADRLDRIEKAQAEPAAKLVKLTETVEKLRVAAATPAPPPVPAPAVVPPPPPAPAPVASAPAKDATAAIPAKETASQPKQAEVARLPILDGWVLLGAGNGSATIEGRAGIFDVFAGDPVPGLGRIDAIRRQDGRWVVVTNKGLIVAR